MARLTRNHPRDAWLHAWCEEFQPHIGQVCTKLKMNCYAPPVLTNDAKVSSYNIRWPGWQGGGLAKVPIIVNLCPSCKRNNQMIFSAQVLVRSVQANIRAQVLTHKCVCLTHGRLTPMPFLVSCSHCRCPPPSWLTYCSAWPRSSSSPDPCGWVLS